ncbi:tetracycline resistance transcriptional repressor TetR [Rhizobium sp. BK377]|uniref:tetracycline resistance transcriptional repressor TetR n=1 Tax=Rhizobium sp. BK377 TaxID=2587058 RepID=UPI001612D000|nr:tetracycline resistance transcriptional repressor TetR [Rhizobium sp. BK377]MBB3460196.1 TetR/AcrR family tetracycline transcriptional repressor [Rhizobium sp. BK377]
MKVDRAQIVDEALKLLNEVGIDALSTRMLAERLDVRQPALYWHFKSKRALVEAMAEEIMARGHTHDWSVVPENWREFMLENARDFRRTLLSYRDGARVHAGTETSPQDLPNVEAHIAVLVGAGIEAEFAMELLVAVARYTVGCVIEEQAEPPPEQEKLDAAAADFPLTHRAIAHYRKSGHEAFFEAGLQMIIDGAERRLAESA